MIKPIRSLLTLFAACAIALGMLAACGSTIEARQASALDSIAVARQASSTAMLAGKITVAADVANQARLQKMVDALRTTRTAAVADEATSEAKAIETRVKQAQGAR
jgi:hypothetical protein